MALSLKLSGDDAKSSAGACCHQVYSHDSLFRALFTIYSVVCMTVSVRLRVDSHTLRHLCVFSSFYYYKNNILLL